MRPLSFALPSATLAAALALLTPVHLGAQSFGGWIVFGGGQRDRGSARFAYEQGYREGLALGVEDGRRGRAVDLNRHRVYRNADRGYSRDAGNRGNYQRAFRDGFGAGYRAGFDRARGGNGRWGRDDQRGRRPARGGFEEPASARGYSDGYEQGLDDGRDNDRYDPVRHGDYRGADNGYYREYGNREGYRNNYRAGFRQGYEDGYRQGAWRRR